MVFHNFFSKCFISSITKLFSCILIRDPKPYSEPYQTSKMESFAKIVNGFQPLTIFAKRSIIDAGWGFECIYEIFS